jgi:hypothetical protein
MGVTRLSHKAIKLLRVLDTAILTLSWHCTQCRGSVLGCASVPHSLAQGDGK